MAAAPWPSIFAGPKKQAWAGLCPRISTKLSWTEDCSLHLQLFQRASRTFPGWAEVHRELRGKGVTIFLLWEEYKQNDPDGYQYSWFCEQYRKWAEKVDVVIRQEHRAGEELFVDYACQTVAVMGHGKKRCFCLFRESLSRRPVDENAIDLSLASDCKDFEDAVQYYSAVNAKSDCLITRNKTDGIINQ